MADRRRGDEPPAEGTPEYRWLYGEDPSHRPAPPDATRHIKANRPPAPPAPPPVTTPYPTARPPVHGQRGAGVHPQAPRPGAPQPFAPQYPGVPPEAPGRRPRTDRGAGRPRRRGVGRTLRTLLLLWLVFLVATPIYAWSKVNRVEAITEHASSPGGQAATTYLVVGSDSRSGLTPEEQRRLGTGPDDVGQRTDTIMLLHVGKGPNVLTSIPRDSRVEIPGHGVSKINAAFAWGGAPLLVETVEHNTGIEVDHYVEIGFGGLVKMVDALGGIQICPAKPMKDPAAQLDISAGCQEADGATALGYARSRKTYKALGDVDRAKAQREVVSAIGAKALSPMTVINPVRYFRLATSTAASLTVSEGSGPLAMARFGLGMTRVDGTKGLTCSVPISDLSVRWDSTRSKQFFEYLRSNSADEMPRELCTASGFAERP